MLGKCLDIPSICRRAVHKLKFLEWVLRIIAIYPKFYYNLFDFCGISLLKKKMILKAKGSQWSFSSVFISFLFFTNDSFSDSCKEWSELFYLKTGNMIVININYVLFVGIGTSFTQLNCVVFLAFLMLFSRSLLFSKKLK